MAKRRTLPGGNETALTDFRRVASTGLLGSARRAAGVPVRIAAIAEYAPRTRVTSSSLDARWGKSDGWTERHSGIRARRVAAPDETTSAMGAEAARRALDAAGVALADVDCIVSACSVMEQPIPCTGALIQRALGLGDSGVPAFDVNATCLSLLTALDLAATAIAAGRWRRMLLVSSEIASAGLPWDDPATAMLFGDGAVAMLVEPALEADSARVLAAHFETYSDGAALCEVRAGGTRVRLHDDPASFARQHVFRMDGPATYRLAATKLPAFLDRLLARAEVRAADVAAFIPHQASEKALHHLQRALQLPAEQVVSVLPERGNQMAASVGVALGHALDSGRVRRGDLVALVGSGAGLSFGGLVLQL